MEAKHQWHDGCVNTVHFTPSGRWLITGSDDQMVVIGDWQTGAVRLAYNSGHRNNVFQVTARAPAMGWLALTQRMQTDYPLLTKYPLLPGQDAPILKRADHRHLRGGRRGSLFSFLLHMRSVPDVVLSRAGAGRSAAGRQ
eukprot:3034807-Rhodomonas_salina.2